MNSKEILKWLAFFFAGCVVGGFVIYQKGHFYNSGRQSVTIKEKPQHADADDKPIEISLPESDRTQAFADIEKVMNSARAIPVKEADTIVGFRFLDIQPDSIWSKIGLKNNDVITQVNDDMMNSAVSAMNVYSSLRSDKKLKVKIVRDSIPKLLEISFQ